MAETTNDTNQTSTQETEIKKYDYNGYNLNADDLVKDLNTNLSGYVKYMHWDNATADQFKEALDKYIRAINSGSLSSDYLGRLIDSSGELTNTPLKYYSAANTEGLSAEDYSKLSRKDKRGYNAGFLANQQVAAYINSVAKARYDYEKKINDAADARKKKEEEERNKPIMFDVATHGLEQFAHSGGTYGDENIFVGSLYGTDPEAWMRSNAKGLNRAQALGEFIKNNYKPYIENTNFDFSKTSWKTKDNYISALSDAIEELSNSIFSEDNPLDYQVLGQLQEDQMWYKYLLNDEQPTTLQQANPSGSGSEAGEVGEEMENNNTISFRKTDINLDIPDFDQNISDSTSLEADNEFGYSTNSPNTEDYKNDLVEKLVTNKDSLTNVPKKNLLRLCNIYLSPKEGSYVELTYDAGYLFPKMKYTQGGYSYYVCCTKDKKKIFVVKRADSTENKKNGGTLVNKYKEGDTVTVLANDFNSANNSKYKLPDWTQRVLDRQSIFTRNKNLQNTSNYYVPDESESGSLTTAEIVRLSSILPDIAAAVNPDGLTSLCLGLGSTAMNAFADFMENPKDLGTNLKNLGFNFGMSVIGAIPLLGGVGNSLKIVRVLKNIVPKIIKILSTITYGGIVSNEVGALSAKEGTDESKQSIIKSLLKIGQSGPENEMTVGDWKNVLMGIRTVLSFRRGFKNWKSYKELKKTVGNKSSSVMGKNPDAQYGVIAKVENDSDKSKIVTIALRDCNGDATKFGKKVNNAIIKKENKATRKKVNKATRKKVNDDFLTQKMLSDNIEEVKKVVNDFLNTETTAYKNFKVAKNFGNIKFWNTYGLKSNKAINKYGLDRHKKVNKWLPFVVERKDKFWNNPIHFSDAPVMSQMRNNTDVKDFFGNSENRFFNKGRRRSNLWWLLRGGIEDYPGSEIVSLDRIGGRLNRVHRILYAQPGTKIYGKENSDFNNVLEYNSLYGDEYNGLTYKGILNGVTVDLRNNKDTVGTLQSPRNKYKQDQTLEDIAQGKNSMISGWQNGKDNRVKDFLSYYGGKKKSDENLTLIDILDSYNNDIKRLYELKRKIADKQKENNNTYISNNDVAEFNKLYNKVYPTMGTTDYVGFYDDTESGGGKIIKTFGTSTAERGIDITNEDISNFNEDDIKKLDELLGEEYTGYHFVKDKSGLWHLEKNEATANSAAPEESSDPEGPKSMTDLPIKTGQPAQQNNNRVLNFSLVDPLNIARYLNMRNANRLQLRNDMQAQPLLHVPTETQRWVYGNQAEVQAGHQMAGMLNHLASTVSTSDPNIQAENFMKEFNQGLGYIQQGNQKNDEQIEKTREAQFAQSKENQQNRADVAKENREEMHTIDLEKLKAKNRYYNAQAQNLDALLREFLDSAADKEAERKELLDVYESVSLSNEIVNDPAKYGLDFSEEDLQIYRDVISGKKKLSTLTGSEKEMYNVISRAITQKKTEIFLSRRGISYTPVNVGYNTGDHTYTIAEGNQTGEGNSATNQASGGILRLRKQAKRRKIYNS